MKKNLFAIVIALFAINYGYSQTEGMKLGGHIAIPVGSAADVSGFGLQADFNYLFNVEGSLYAGPMANLIWYNTKKNYKDIWFLPIGGAARYAIQDFFVGIDLAYAIGLAPTGNRGGFLYRPKVGYNLGNPDMALIMSYSGISLKGGNAGSINFGVEFKL